MKSRFTLLVALAVAIVGIAAPTIALAERSAPQTAVQIATPQAQPAAPAATGVAVLFSCFALLGIVNSRTLKDLNLQAIKAFPAAAATNQSASIDTGNTNPGRLEDCELLLEVPATPSLVDTKTIILTIQDSADNINFAAQAELPTQTLLGAGGVGAAAIAVRLKIPITCARYIRVNQVVLAAGGDNTAISSTLSVIF